MESTTRSRPTRSKRQRGCIGALAVSAAVVLSATSLRNEYFQTNTCVTAFQPNLRSRQTDRTQQDWHLTVYYQTQGKTLFARTQDLSIHGPTRLSAQASAAGVIVHDRTNKERESNREVRVKSRKTVAPPTVLWDSDDQERKDEELLPLSRGTLVPVTLTPKTQQRTKDDTPPWLDGYLDSSAELDKVEVEDQVEWLEYELLEEGFAVTDIQEIVKGIYTVTAGDLSLVTGTLEFLRLLLSLKQGENEEYDTPSKLSEGGFVNKDIILAAIIHYADCIAARRNGLHEIVEDLLFGREQENEKHFFRDTEGADIESAALLLPSTRQDTDNETDPSPSDDPVPTNDPPSSDFSSDTATTEVLLDDGLPAFLDLSGTEDGSIENVVALQVARDAARIKRAEILTQVVRSGPKLEGKEHNLAEPLSWTAAESAKVRGLLLSVGEDWRALALRCVASLYRLEGISKRMDHPVHGASVADYLERTPQMVQTAREAMRVYATLAQRLGMHRLKTRIEERAFRILYRRQYKAVSTLYQDQVDTMRELANHLREEISWTLTQDENLMSQVEGLDVSCRVKEPYSFWKKLLKKKVTQPLQPALSGVDDEQSDTTGSPRTPLLSRSASLSVTEVNDGIALRVILQPKNWSADESDENAQTRERLLCYYAHHLIRTKWPATDPSRTKDYIRFPKPNGYQSLHHTSSIVGPNGVEFPFEVQIRSDEMHRRAEFGVAAHWDYKLGSPAVASTEQPKLLPAPTDLETKPRVVSKTVTSDETPSKSYVDALASARQGLIEEHVYVFLAGSGPNSSQGRLVSLAPNSSVQDAVDAISETLEGASHKESLAKATILRNGKLTKLEDPILNGDVVMVTL